MNHLGGESGARLAARLAMPTSPDTLLRRVRQGIPEAAPTPRGLGVDDFAVRTGARSGTILVALERRRVVDRLPDREATTVAAWLRARPGVEVVSRVRAGASSAQAASAAVPDAVQVADRWHLLKNARDAAERLLQRRSTSVRVLLGGRSEGPPAGPETARCASSPGSAREAARERKREQRQARFEQVRRRHSAGGSLRGIARALRIKYQTVPRSVRSDAGPDWQPGRRRPSDRDRFEDHIRGRIAVGCDNARQLLRELQMMGYRGARTMVQ